MNAELQYTGTHERIEDNKLRLDNDTEYLMIVGYLRDESDGSDDYSVRATEELAEVS